MLYLVSVGLKKVGYILSGRVPALNMVVRPDAQFFPLSVACYPG